jgi:hypothetical protein
LVRFGGGLHRHERGLRQRRHTAQRISHGTNVPRGIRACGSAATPAFRAPSDFFPAHRTREKRRLKKLNHRTAERWLFGYLGRSKACIAKPYRNVGQAP